MCKEIQKITRARHGHTYYIDMWIMLYLFIYFDN